jgi:hypothetical protein
LYAAGQLAIRNKSISRKHLTIQVEAVEDGDGVILALQVQVTSYSANALLCLPQQNLLSRSKITVEDLKTKHGSAVNGQLLKGERHVVTGTSVDIKLGQCQDLFRYEVKMYFVAMKMPCQIANLSIHC